MKLINKIIIYFINKFLAKEKKDIIIRYREEPIELDKMAEKMNEIDREEEKEKYSNQYW